MVELFIFFVCVVCVLSLSLLSSYIGNIQGTTTTIDDSVNERLGKVNWTNEITNMIEHYEEEHGGGGDNNRTTTK